MVNSTLSSADTRSSADVVNILMRHKKKMALYFLTTMSLVVLAIMLSPRKYESEARLFIRMGRETLTLDPTATTGQVINSFEPREQEINTIKDMLKSRTLVEQVVDKLGPQAILKPKANSSADQQGPGWIAQARQTLERVGLADSLSDRDRAIEKLLDRIDISASEKSNVVRVSCTSSTPKMAQRIGEEFLATYRDRHMRAHRTLGSLDFFSSQARKLKQDLAEAEDKLREAKNEAGIVTIEAKQETLKQQLGLIEIDLLSTDAAIRASQAKIRALDGSFAKMSDRLITEERTETSDAADEMRAVLFELQIREREITSRFQPEHPTAIAIRQQVEASQKLLDAEEKRRVQPTRALNPAHQQQKLSFYAEEADVASHQARFETLSQQHDQLQEQLRNLNQVELELAQHHREVNLLNESYLTYSKNLEQARIDSELEVQDISNLNVVQPPSFNAKPVSPRKALIAILGFCVATFGAIGLALLCENWNGPLRTSHDVEAVLDLPVLQTVANVSRNGSSSRETVSTG